MTIAGTLAAGAMLLEPGKDWSASSYFDVTELDDACVATSHFEFDGRSDVRFFLSYDGDQAFITLTSLDWSKPTDDVSIQWDFLPITGFTGNAVGITNESIYDGFAGKFGPDVLDAFAAATSLMVSRDETVITHINLAGSGAATAALKRCVQAVERQNAAKARAEQQWDYIAEDPFGRPPAATGNTGSAEPAWSRRPAPEYPARALSQGISAGSVVLQCVPRPDGSVGLCTVISETPEGAGFAQAALAGVRLAQLAPASADQATVRFTIRFAVAD